MGNNTKGAGDDYPIIPQPDPKTDEFRLQNYRAMENRLLSANSDLKHLKEELASLKEENAKLKGLLKESHKAFEYGELELRTTYKRFTGYKGSSSLWTMQEMIEKLKPFSDNK